MTETANQQHTTPDGPDPRHQQAFELYWSLGQKRSYGRVARRIGVSASTIKLWSRQQRWQQRIVEREVQQSRQLADSVESSPDPESLRNLKIVRVAILKIAKAIAEGRVRASMGDLDRMVRLEERLTGTHGINPRKLAAAAEYLVELEHMSLPRLRAELRQVALDWGVIRQEELVDPEGGIEPAIADAKGSESEGEGTIGDNPEESP